MESTDIASSLIASIQAQSSLLLSLSTALLGGAAALLVQLKVQDGKVLPLRLNPWLWSGGALLAISCILSWIVLGALIDKTPVIMSIEFDGKAFSTIREIKESTALTWAANGQFLTFVVGAVVTIVGLTKLARE